MSGGRLKRGRERGLSKFAWAPCFAAAWGLMAAGFLGDPARAAQIAPNPNLGVISVQHGSNDVDFLNQGDLTVSGSFLNTSSLTNQGVASLHNFNNLFGGVITNQGTLSTSGIGFSEFGTITNHSTWILDGEVHASGGALTNYGDIQASGGDLVNSGGDLLFAPGSTFTGSLGHDGGTARIFGFAQLERYAGAGLLEIGSSGTVTNALFSTYNLSVAGNFANLEGGTVQVAVGEPGSAISVESGGTFLNEGTLFGDLVNNAGTFTQSSTGITQVAQLTNDAGGVLTAEGTWEVADFVNQGTATLSNLDYATGRQVIHNDGVVYTDLLNASPFHFHQGPNGRVVVSQNFDFYSDGLGLEGTVQGLPGAFARLAGDAIIGTTGRLEFDWVDASGTLLNRGDLVVGQLSTFFAFENEGFFSGSLNAGSTGLVNRGHAVVHNQDSHSNDPTIFNEASGLLETFNLAVATVQNDGHWITRGTHGGSTTATGRSVGVLEHAEGALNLFNFHLDGLLRVGTTGEFVTATIWESTIGPDLTIENSGYLDLTLDHGSGRPALLRQLAGDASLDPRSAPLAIEIHGGQVGFWGDFTQAADESLSIVLKPNDQNAQGLIRASQRLSFLGRVEFGVDQPEQLVQGMEFLVAKAQGIDLSQATVVLPDLSAWLLRLVVDVVDLPSNSPFSDLDGLRIRVLAIPEPGMGMLLVLAVGVLRRRHARR